jgi:hypothetical protein
MPPASLPPPLLLLLPLPAPLLLLALPVPLLLLALPVPLLLPVLPAPLLLPVLPVPLLLPVLPVPLLLPVLPVPLLLPVLPVPLLPLPAPLLPLLALPPPLLLPVKFDALGPPVPSEPLHAATTVPERALHETRNRICLRFTAVTSHAVQRSQSTGSSLQSSMETTRESCPIFWPKTSR